MFDNDKGKRESEEGSLIVEENIEEEDEEEVEEKGERIYAISEAQESQSHVRTIEGTMLKSFGEKNRDW